MIQTVLGSIDKEEIRHAQCHEHLFIAKGKSYEVNPVLWMDEPVKSFEELKKYHLSGGNLIVDAQPIGCGRMADALVSVSLGTGVNIVASTGFHKLLFYPQGHWIHSISPDKFTEIMIDEIETGMYIGCDNEFPLIQIMNKAGMIKIACDKSGLTSRYKSMVSSAAEASLKTGMPVQCHIEDIKTAYSIGEFLLSKGIPKENIILAHLDRDATTIKEMLRVAQLGVFLELDTIGRYKYHDDNKEAEIIETLIANGFEDKLIIGLDTTRARLSAYGGEIGLDYILRSFLPFIRHKGITDEIIIKMVKSNPSIALSKILK